MKNNIKIEDFELGYEIPDVFDRAHLPSASKMYVAHFGTIPHITTLKLHYRLDLSNATKETFSSIFSEIIFYRKYITKLLEKNSDNITQFEEDDEFFRDDMATFVMLFTNELGVVITTSEIILYHNETTSSDIDSILKKISRLFPKFIREKPNSIGLITVDSNFGFRTTVSELKKVDLDIKSHYNDDFPPVYDDIISFLDSRGSGLIILHGERGSGKTNFIRYLCQEHPKHYIIVPNGIAPKLGMPDFLDYMQSNKDSVFILEDCEQLLMDREENNFNDAISTILNMSDGLLSDVFNAKFICTFNADVEKIDQALLRKGRCFAKYRFDKLSAEKTGALLRSLGYDVSEPEPMTLAEIYNYNSRLCINSKRKKIGF